MVQHLNKIIARSLDQISFIFLIYRDAIYQKIRFLKNGIVIKFILSIVILLYFIKWLWERNWVVIK
jgi:hypothetical protein